MTNDKDKWYKKNRWIATLIILCLGAFDVYFLLDCRTNITNNILFYIGIMGIINFFVILLLMFYLSGSKNLEQGEMRRAIAGSFIIAYFALLSLVTFEDSSTSFVGMSKTLIDHFTYLVGIIVVFYFGSSSVQEYIKNKNNQQKAQQEHEIKVLEKKAELNKKQKEPKLNNKTVK